jgi:hypothetical protein
MSWATGRRLVIIIIGAAFTVALIALILIPTFYKSPSCTDSTQNQGEAGVDCGGPCSYLCVYQKSTPVVSLQRALVQTPNRADVIAYIENPNFDAASRGTSYRITLYAPDHTVLKTSTGRIDLPAGTRVPIYAPGFFIGNVSGVQGFLEVVTSSLGWYPSSPVPLPTVSNIRFSGTNDAPRITATLSNPGTLSFSNTKVIVVVYDSAKNIIGASQTLIPAIAGQSEVTATFTWSLPFKNTPAIIEVTPVPVLGAGV